MPISVKIADLGNATPTRKHYTEDIQTRQYRSPEAILGRTDWGATADMWSAACVVFELLTAEYLFDPQSQGELFGKDDDHCAQITELVGAWPQEVLWGGRYSREIFDANGACCPFVHSIWVWGFRGPCVCLARGFLVRFVPLLGLRVTRARRMRARGGLCRGPPQWHLCLAPPRAVAVARAAPLWMCLCRRAVADHERVFAQASCATSATSSRGPSTA